MLRCASTLTVLLALTLPAGAQVQRNFTDQALRGEVTFGQPPEVTLNGKPARLAPGARVRDADNLIQMPATLAGRKAVVNYTLELEGQLLDVWILTAQEAAKAPWPRTPQEARAWSFSDGAQAWVKP
ncbi:MAG TPA: hypothetical protein VFZ07_02690 [Dongiaceae bacterium]